MKDEDSEHEKCGYCNMYLLGKLQSGIKCETCDQVYHEDCFTTDSENPSIDRRFSVMSDLSSSETIVPIPSQDVFDCGGISRDESEKRLAGRKPGSFLLRISPSEGDHIISRLTAGDRLKVDHLKVSQSEVGDVTFYSLMPGQGRRTILDLVNNHREDFQLFHPVNCPFSAASREAELLQPDIAEDEERHYVDFNQLLQQREETAEEASPEEVDVVTEEESFQGYNHGTITRAEAEEKLDRQVEGTFLLREGADGLRLSRVPHMSGNFVKHFIVHRDARDSYYLTGNHKFSSVEEMIRFYQNVDNADKYWLGAPLYTPEALDKVNLRSPQRCRTSIFSYQESQENLTDDQMMRNRDNSRRGEPGSLPFYHGTMCNPTANKTLVRESPGTFLVRKTHLQQFFLSYKTVSGREIVHSKITSTQNPNSTLTYYSIEGARASTSIRRLVEDLKSKEVLTIGLIPRCRNSNWSPSNSVDHGLEPRQLETSAYADIPRISKEEVQNMLKNSAHGSYVVRTNERGQVRVSYVAQNTVKHKMLYRQHGGLFTMTTGAETPVSLKRIITVMKEQKVILNELNTKRTSNISY